MTHNSWTMYSPPHKWIVERLVDANQQIHKQVLITTDINILLLKKTWVKCKTCDRCFSITLTMTGADSTFSSASMVNILMSGLLFTVKSAKDDMYSSPMTSCCGLFCTSSAISRPKFWISKILPHSTKYLFWWIEEMKCENQLIFKSWILYFYAIWRLDVPNLPTMADMKVRFSSDFTYLPCLPYIVTRHKSSHRIVESS